MSTANKLTYLNETKQELKQKINNLGGEITDETTFREYADKLQNVYDNAPKTSYAEGSNITLSNTLKGKLDFEDDIVGYGQTSQEGTPTPDNPQEIEVVRGNIEATIRGINLLELKIPTITLNGITCINNEDGSLTFSGTATDNVNFRIDQISQSGPYVLKNYKAPYTMSLLNVEGTNKGTMYLGGYIDGSWSTPNCNIGTVAVKNKNLDNAFCYIRFNKDDVINETIYPMILNGSYTASTIPPFQPYQEPKTYQLSLGEYEFAKIGNYVDTIEYDVDEDKVYKNKAIGKKNNIVGNDFVFYQSNVGNQVYQYRTVSHYFNDVNLTPDPFHIEDIAYSNYFLKKDDVNALNNYYFTISGTGTLVINTPFSTLQVLKEWIDSVNLIIYYQLATAVKEEITTTLKDQIKALYNSHSFNGTTIIEIDGQLPLIMKVRALKGE